MCSKTSSESYGDDYSVLCPKKQKHNNGRRRVPRRGPGVAELEKIRLEEQHNSSTAPLPSPPLPPPPEKTPLPFLPTTTERTGPVYPFASYFSTGSFPNDFIPPAPVFQRNHDSSLHYLPPMNLPNPGTGGFYQFIEPPSNQSLDNVSQFLDEEKIVAAKKARHYIAETTRCNFGPTITISSDGKQIKSLDQRLKSHIQDSGTTIRNPITIDSTSPTPIISSPSLDFPLFLQKEGFNNETMQRRSVGNISTNRKPFYSFLPANEQSTRDKDLSFSLKTERYDTVNDHGIDLRLKL